MSWAERKSSRHQLECVPAPSGYSAEEQPNLNASLRDKATAVSSFTLQEAYFLWHTFLALARSKKMSHAVFAAHLSYINNTEAVEWLYDAVDADEDGAFGFLDFIFTSDRVVRGAAHERAQIVWRVLVETQSSKYLIRSTVMRRLSVLTRGKEVTPQQVEADVETLFAHGDAQGRLDYRKFFRYGPTCASFQAVLDQLFAIFGPSLRDMAAKLKRESVLNLENVCRSQKTALPVPMQTLLTSLRRKANESAANVADFEPSSLKPHRTLIEALANGFLQGVITEQELAPLEAPVLFMALRTYLRHFNEPFFTLQFSRELLKRCSINSSRKWRAILMEVVDLLPPSRRLACRELLEFCHSLAGSDNAILTMSRVYAYVLIRAERKASSTADVAIALTAHLIAHFPDYFSPRKPTNDGSVGNG